MEIRNNLQFDPFAENAGYDSDSCPVDLKGIDWSDPSSFMKLIGGGGRIPEKLSPDKILQQTQERKSSIFKSYDTLRDILDRHELTIRKRWTKKSRQQRLAILLSAWPNMPESHRPDFKAFRVESQKQREAGTRFRSHFLWPHVNQEDLCKPKLLPMLLNARARHPPWAFAAADREAMQFGCVTKALVPGFLNLYTMVLNNPASRGRYAELLTWEGDFSAMGLATSRKEFLPGEGLLVLEAQDKLLEFLVDCCRKILCDIPRDDLIGDTFPIQPEPELKFGVDVAGFASLAVMAEEAPYRPPAILDLGKLEELLEAKKHEIEDHLWALREDPAYFVQELKEAKEHRLEFVKDARGRLHPVANNLREKIWGLSLANILRYSHESLELFSELHRQARDLRLLQQKYQGQISPAEDLPEKYSDALLVFRNFLNQAAKMPLNQLKEVAPGSPPMRKFFVREPFEDLCRTDHVVRDKNGKKTKSEENLLWLLRTLWEDGHTLLFARLPLVVDELERVLQTEPVADELVTAHVMKVIGDLSIVAQCFKQVDVYYPWAHGFDHAYYGKKDQIDAAFNKWNCQWMKAAGTTFTMSGLEAAVGLAEPTGGKFDYPYGKRRTRENVEALQRAEANLDSIWTEVDRAARFHEPRWHGTAIRGLLSQPRLLRRTAEWVEPPKAKSASDVKANVQALERPLSNLFIGESEGGTARPARPAPSKTKTKTRGASSAVKGSDAPAEPEAGPSGDHDPQPTFEVDARALKVFRLLFFDPDATSTPGTISWTEFLHAMTATGFQAEKLYGSVWQFLPTKLGVERGIHFHEPHPKAKLAFEVARRYGRRLNRAYGWHGAMFVLKG